LDIPGRKFYILSNVYWPQDVFYLALLLIVLTGILFLFTAVAGRLWCGYACPQSVFTDIFLTIERFIEGSALKRQRLDDGSWGAAKIAKKLFKHIVWISISFLVAFTFVAYFIPAEVLLKRLITGTLSWSNVIWLLSFTGATYSFCALLRELICLVPCPYGRFQSALLDADTLVIGYDIARGEPRGHKLREDSGEKLGDCIDCSLCVQVCPTGIDIRNGLQCECIGCALCIDACNEVMCKIGRPKGLVRYTSMRALSGGVTRVLRPRVIAYTLCMIALIGYLGYELKTRIPLEMQILRDRRALFIKGAHGSITNVYTLRVSNMDREDHQYKVSTEVLATGLKVSIGMGENPISVKSGEVYQGSLLLTTQAKSGDKINNLYFVVKSLDDEVIGLKRKTTFVMP
jgi:cytochrome c oxidase accessory protein FixG